MARKFTDANRIPCLIECYEKEKWLRMHWVNSQFDRLLRAATLTREPTDYTESEIKESVMVAGMATITRDHIVAGTNKNTAAIKDIDLVRLGEVKKLEPAMISVPDGIKKVLYKDRKDVYLKMRYAIPPDKKYQFIECENWKYGWQFDKSENKLMGSSCGRKYYVSRIAGVGPQPDPTHYRDCKEISNLCTQL